MQKKNKIKKFIKPLFMKLPFSIRGRMIRLYGRLFLESKSKVREVNISGDVSVFSRDILLRKRKLDILLFPVIDWGFRMQRPQHLAKEIANNGGVVIYFSTKFNVSKNPGFKVLDNPSSNVFIISLNLKEEGVNVYKDKLNNEQISFLSHSIAALRLAFNFGHTVSIVNLPFWRELVEQLPSNKIVYDCMDHHAGFENNDVKMLNEEIKLFNSSDLVVTTASRLSEHVNKYAKNVIIRNAADVEYFSSTLRRQISKKSRKIIGYYGAIAEWFDLELLIDSAKSLPECDFVLIGAITIDVSSAKNISNIIFLGEKPYEELTTYLSDFDVCIIPFKLIELTLCTNPVKVYEYLAAGKPVVCTAMPEVINMMEVVHVADSSKEFTNKIELSLTEIEDESLYEKRKLWAKQHSWKNRSLQLISEIESIYIPKVSIIVLTFNNFPLTKSCLNSIELNTKYENYEVIIVDNCSTDETRNYLNSNYVGRSNYKVILNDNNVGFAAGNNIGLEAATGDILVILNNDTYVSPFWLGGLVKALKENSELGIVGPVTNNIGNESKINIEYSNWSEMNQAALCYTTMSQGRLMKLDCLAFFCVAIRREVYEKLGGICEEYGLGFFEDDDYCMRVKAAGWELACVENSFVHHHLSASFNKLKDNKKQKLMDRNKAIFESKWGEWKPHRYRKGVF